ncbi:unnamed protein product [Ceutorhynchus assimilis]|uniref:Protein hunchback n=1 Tax=Ceutorhynchus assimilis TaxID=467358 RepID=A0A9N9QPY1_9CUCU|nr:unnamed protein product [Ceutorhynchus assimilis]
MRGEVSEMSAATGIRPSMSYSSPVKVFEQRQETNSPWTEFDSNHMPHLFAARVKNEPMDDTRNDSGVTSGSDCPSTSPASDRSDSHPNTASPTNIYPLHHWYPKTSPETHASDDRSSVSPKPELPADENSTEFDEDGIRVPKVNSHGKVKVHKCKQCEFYAYTKLEFWEHSRVHIKGDKILKCPKCPFVTEYKHHLEYHLLNHAGAKPFKCQHCDYSCVNKSMLNSHLKSHSKVYQYRCSNCHYETKYCHSLKLHLRKYGHKPAMVLNPDGSPNPLPIIDVYGTRRGPKVKKSSANESRTNFPEPSNPSPPPQMPLLMNPALLGQNPMMPFPLPLFPAGLPNPEIMMNFQNLFRERLEELAKQNPALVPQQQQDEPEHQPQQNGALDLTNKSNHSSENGDSEDDEAMTIAFDNVEVVANDTENTTLTPDNVDEKAKNNNTYEFACQYCGICFGDEVMFRIHMGYHGYSNPFTCNMCGEECQNKVKFFLHIARAAH